MWHSLFSEKFPIVNKKLFSSWFSMVDEQNVGGKHKCYKRYDILTSTQLLLIH